MKRLFIVVAVLVVVPLLVHAETETASSSVPTDLRIGKITVLRSNVFGESSGKPQPFLYRTANRLHIVTREEFIRNDLTFKEGDPYDPERLAESERLLRGRPIFRYVRIETLPPHDGVVDVVVETNDVWTTSVQLDYGTAGGVSYYEIGFLENNFLGQGKVVGAFLEQGIDRLTRGVSYEDRQFLGSRWDAFGGYGRDQKGRDWEAALTRPFYSTRVPASGGGSVFVSDDQDRLFQNGDEVVRFDHRRQNQRVFGALETDSRPDFARRWTLAFERQEDRFGAVEFLVPPPVFRNRTVAAALAGFDYQDQRFEKFRGVRTFDRDEDVNMGWEWKAEAGPSLESLGATRDGSFGRALVKKVVILAGDDLWFNRLDLSGRGEARSVHNGIMRFRSELYVPQWRPDNTASLRGEWVASHNLDPENQFLLGGESGLRGYSVRQFAGDNSLLVTLENRRAVLYDWLRLVSIGWAVFGDAGAVWSRHTSLDTREIKSDVGLGIRLAPSRSVDPGLLRIDVAYALDDNQQPTRFVLNIGADIRFGEHQLRKFDQ